MKPGGGRNKGNSFERVIAKQIVDAGKHLGLCKEDCYRTPSSGGHRYAKQQDPSDLVLSPKLLKYFPLIVECKHYKYIDLQQLWTKKGQIFTWLDQVLREAKGQEDRYPAVIMRWNHSQTFCIIDSAALTESPWINYVKLELKKGVMLGKFRYKKVIWWVMLFDTVLDVFIKNAKRVNK